MKFIPDYPIGELKPADYNPRSITREAFEMLKASLVKFGVVKPVILNGTGILTAGHQRVKAMKEIGLRATPAILLANISLQDEIRFNLFHNSIEMNKTEVHCEGAAGLEPGYHFIPSSQIRCGRNANAIVIKEISELFVRYGSWGSVVIDGSGRVICNSDYAFVSKAFEKPVLAYKMPQEKVREFLRFINTDYGEYHYENLGINAYNQYHCQMRRLRGGRKLNQSQLYERRVLPGLRLDERVLDFGAGQCDYYYWLRSRGYRIFAYEPHYVQKSKLMMGRITGFIEEITRDVAAHGLYGKVVLDSVLNSVTSVAYEEAVVLACNALLGRDGTFYVATRSYEFEIESTMRQKKCIQNKNRRRLQFVDRNNFAASFREGHWTMQKFHTAASLGALLDRYFESVEVFRSSSALNDGVGNHHAICRGPRRFPVARYREALELEFNMPYPRGYRHNREGPLVKLLCRELKKRDAERK